jgi:hypothetical protein
LGERLANLIVSWAKLRAAARLSTGADSAPALSRPKTIVVILTSCILVIGWLNGCEIGIKPQLSKNVK